MKGVADPKIQPPHMCYHVKFGSSVTKGIQINKRKLLKLGSAGTPPSLRTCYLVKFGREHPKLGTLGPSPLATGGVGDSLEIHQPSHVCSPIAV